VGDATTQVEHLPVRELEPDGGLLAYGEKCLGPDVQAARGDILGLRLDRSGRTVELDPASADESLIAAPTSVCHLRKDTGVSGACLLCTKFGLAFFKNL